MGGKNGKLAGEPEQAAAYNPRTWNLLPHEVADLAVYRRAVFDAGVAEAADIRIGGAAEDGAGVGVDQLVAAGPKGAVVDGARGLVAGVELVKEAGARDHLVAGREEEAAVGPGGAVVRAGKRDPVVDVYGAPHVLQVVTAGEAAHGVGDDVDFRGAGGRLDLVDAGGDILGDEGVGLGAAEGVGEEAVGLPAVGLEAGDRGVPGRGVGRVPVNEEDRIDVAGGRLPGRKREGSEEKREKEQAGKDKTTHGMPLS